MNAGLEDIGLAGLETNFVQLSEDDAEEDQVDVATQDTSDAKNTQATKVNGDGNKKPVEL